MYEESSVLRNYEKIYDQNEKSNSETVEKILASYEKPDGYFRILDIGCGLSPLLRKLRESLSEKQLSYLGIDSSHAMIETAKKINEGSEKVQVKYLNIDTKTMLENNDFPWYNMVIVQNFIHLILDDEEIAKICKFISKILSNNGVFYMSTKTTIRDCEHIEGDVYLVPKIGESKFAYRRRIFTMESFDRLITSIFRAEGTYKLNVFTSCDDLGNEFINIIGTKCSDLLFSKYKYNIGFDERLKHMKMYISTSTDCIEYVNNPVEMKVIRKEELLKNLYSTNFEMFKQIMDIMRDIISRADPTLFPVYMKDKLNINDSSYKFPLHQDVAAGWKKVHENIVTIGIPLTPIITHEQGPTRIGIRQNYIQDESITEKNHTVSEERISSMLGKQLQYLNCFGIEGNYYMFDQYVLHNSKLNVSSHSRDVLFITCALTRDPSLMYSIELANRVSSGKTALDKRKIIALLSAGHKHDDFAIDVFGKISLKTDDNPCNYISLS
jgi:2-polyprenyl-3-methyl-5-hydroxy-6-metoxy-1,4-benzoquinol methylase